MARVVPTAPAAQSMGDRSDLFLFDPLGYARVTVLEPDGCQFKAVKAVRIRAVVAEQRAARRDAARQSQAPRARTCA